MENKEIIIKGARENNLKNVDLTIPRDKLVVFTGVSGSGKSSLAFDTIYAEGQRRYVESLSSYARMFLGQMEKPDVDSIEGLSPAISIDQKTTNNNPQLLKFMTICVFCLPELVFLIVQSVERKFKSRQLTRLLIKLWKWKQEQKFRF